MTVLKYNAEFASQIMSEIPFGYINKTVCGCGLTTLALENKISTVIAVPTIELARNKTLQYPNETCNYEILSVWGETTKDQIERYVQRSPIIKIMCTYDSLSKVEYLLDRCRLIIDECNEIRKLYKGTRTEATNKLLNIAQKYKDTVSFISATPLSLKYLPDWIGEIEQVKIEWENTIKSVPILFKRSYPFKSVINEILKPLKENKELTVANKVFSSVIVFLNSVEKIKDIIKQSELNVEECRIICGDTLKNDVKINGIKRYNPKDNCKYLFITASGFCGIDIYMKDAMTIVVSNTSKNWQMIDLLTDLKQAVSRQRCKNNPNYGSYIYIYNQSIFEKTKEDLLNDLNTVKDKIKDSIDLYKYAVDTDKLRGFTMDEDFKNYTKENKETKYRELDEDAFKSDLYFILEIREQYTKGFDVSTTLENSIIVDAVVINKKSTSYSDLVKYFRENNIEGRINWGNFSDKTEWISLIEQSYKLYKTTWLNISYTKEMLNNYGDDFELLKSTIKCTFLRGREYSRKEVVTTLQTIYDNIGLTRKAKHSDINEVFNTKDKKIKGERMIVILNKK